jgi:excisionase family DNA binding protein
VNRTNQHNLISVPRAAKLCGLSPTTMHALIGQGHIPAVRPSKHLRVKMSDVYAYLYSRAEGRAEVMPVLSAEAEALLRG